MQILRNHSGRSARKQCGAVLLEMLGVALIFKALWLERASKMAADKKPKH